MAEEGAWLWLLEWQLSKFQPNRWKRLPKGTKVRLVSTPDLERLFSAFESGVRPVNFRVDCSDIAEEPGKLKAHLRVNEDFTVVPEAAYAQVLFPYVPQAIEAVIVWQGVLQPSLFLLAHVRPRGAEEEGTRENAQRERATQTQAVSTHRRHHSLYQWRQVFSCNHLGGEHFFSRTCKPTPKSAITNQ